MIISMIRSVSDDDRTYLDTRSSSQGAFQLGEGTRDLIAHSGMALVVVDRTSGGTMASSTVTTSCPSSLGGCGGCGGCASNWVALGSSASVAAA